MLTLGLTGSIGMGKSQTLLLMRRLWRGAAFYDADATVRRLQQQPHILQLLAAHFPDDVSGGVLNRASLAQRIFNNPAANNTLRALLAPHLQHAEKQARALARRRRAPLMVFDIPLLFETSAQRRLHHTALVLAPPFIQRARVLARAGLNMQLFNAIKGLQMPDYKKRQKADFIIPTGLGRAHTVRHLQRLKHRLR